MTTQATVVEAPSTGNLTTSNCVSLRVLCWIVALILGAAQAWASRFTMDPDGISYLDIGDAYWRGDWSNAANAYWSPLYSWILGLFLKLLRPSPAWEFPTVHLANFCIYVATLMAFEFFLSSFLSTTEDLRNDSLVSLPRPALWLLGYVLYIDSTLTLIGLHLVTPDMCVMCFSYLALGLILRIRRRSWGASAFLALGAVLGFGYLAKAVMLPLGVVFFATAALAAGQGRRPSRGAVGGLAIFAVIASIFIVCISRKTGHVTFGESGKLTYAASINKVDPWYPGDGGELVGIGTGHVENIDGSSPVQSLLKHPAKKVFDQPATYSFAGPIIGTYPYWYDPSYWQDGVRPHFSAWGQLQALAQSALMYFYLLRTLYLNIIAPLLVFLLISDRPSLIPRTVLKYWPVLIPCAAGLLIYSLIHTEFRYVAGFLPILWLCITSALTFCPSGRFSRFIVVTFSAVALTTVFFVTKTIVLDALAPTGREYSNVASQLRVLGLHEGDKIGVIADVPFREGGAFIARLARIQIAAQVNRPDRFWSAPPSAQMGTLDALRKADCVGVLGWQIPNPGKGWWRLKNTNYYFYPLRESDSAESISKSD